MLLSRPANESPMDSSHAANGSAQPPGDQPLPPVQPPSALFILQLFVVPGVLVAVIVAFIILFFGWIGGGPETPDQFMQGLRSPSGMKRGKTAQDLAQVLPRKAELRGNVGFALDIAGLLDKELQKPPTVPDPNAQVGLLVADDQSYLLEYYLPAAVGNFHVPVGLPLLSKMAIDSSDKVTGDQAYRLRMRNAVFALALLGARLKEYDALPAEEKERIAFELDTTVQASDSVRADWARQASVYLAARDRGMNDHSPQGLIPALEAGARAPDELARKYTILALANWPGSNTERLLLQLCGDQSDIPDEGFEKPENRPFESRDRERGILEIRQNAALAMARRGSSKTPWELVLDTLNEKQLAEEQYANNPGMAVNWVLKALKDLGQLQQDHPEKFREQAEIVATVHRLSEQSPTVVIRVEAQKLLGDAPELAATPARTSRELLLIGGVGVSVCLLLVLAVFARWRKAAS
jgi:hypothetical protein